MPDENYADNYYATVEDTSKFDGPVSGYEFDAETYIAAKQIVCHHEWVSDLCEETYHVKCRNCNVSRKCGEEEWDRCLDLTPKSRGVLCDERGGVMYG